MYKKRNTNTKTRNTNKKPGLQMCTRGKYKHKDCRNTNTKILTMLKTVELPASVPDLAAGLAHVHADTFPLGTGKYVKWICKCMKINV